MLAGRRDVYVAIFMCNIDYLDHYQNRGDTYAQN